MYEERFRWTSPKFSLRLMSFRQLLFRAQNPEYLLLHHAFLRGPRGWVGVHGASDAVRTVQALAWAKRRGLAMAARLEQSLLSPWEELTE